MPVTGTGRDEEPAEYYDHVYRNAVRTGIYDTARFDAVYDAVLVYFEGARADVHEVGCGGH